MSAKIKNTLLSILLSLSGCAVLTHRVIPGNNNVPVGFNECVPYYQSALSSSLRFSTLPEVTGDCIHDMNPPVIAYLGSTPVLNFNGMNYILRNCEPITEAWIMGRNLPPQFTTNNAFVVNMDNTCEWQPSFVCSFDLGEVFVEADVEELGNQEYSSFGSIEIYLGNSLPITSCVWTGQLNLNSF